MNVPTELYTVTVLKESASTGTDIDGDVLLYLEMAQVRGLSFPPLSASLPPPPPGVSNVTGPVL